jgi:hypothetical protein
MDSAAVRNATPATTTARPNAVTMSTARTEKRSIAAPPMSIRIARGMAAVIITAPSVTLEPVNWSTSQGSATK